MDEAWLSIGDAKCPVAVIEGRTDGSAPVRLRLRRGRLVHSSGDARGPVEVAGLDRRPCVVSQAARGIDEDPLTHLDRVLLPILQRLAREWPVVDAQARTRLDPEVRKLPWHLVARWHALVSSRRLKVPTSTNRIEGWFGCFKPRSA